MSRTSWWVGLGVPLVLVGGLAAWRTQQALERQAAAEDAVTSGPLPVEVQPAARRSLTAAEMIAGTLRPINEVDVVADVPGRALSVQAEIGDHVAAGAVLATLERDDMEAAT
ncbi:MAG TPA: hypothetical protein PKA64_26335 [Myxococcota bacterium]|nr:hypothetical protein [Myxococcota bacterium]